jgi:hypothetical protein
MLALLYHHSPVIPAVTAADKPMNSDEFEELARALRAEEANDSKIRILVGSLNRKFVKHTPQYLQFPLVFITMLGSGYRYGGNEKRNIAIIIAQSS